MDGGLRLVAPRLGGVCCRLWQTHVGPELGHCHIGAWEDRGQEIAHRRVTMRTSVSVDVKIREEGSRRTPEHAGPSDGGRVGDSATTAVGGTEKRAWVSECWR